jgi:hypothetical protein
MWVAGGPDRIVYSYDGILWNISISGSAEQPSVNTIAWNGQVWIASGNADTSPYSSTSYDGINWTNTSDQTYIDAVYGTATNGIQWVIGGDVSGNGGAGINNPLAYSVDPTAQTSWTLSANGDVIFPSGKTYTILWSGSLWIAGGEDAPIAYSSDGITWTAGNSTLVFCYAVASNRVLPNVGTTVIPNRNVGPVTGVAVADLGGDPGSNAIVYTRDGINWQSSTNGDVAMGSTRMESVAYNGIQWLATTVAPIAESNIIIYSSDGITWYPSDASQNTEACYSLAWNGSLWIAGVSPNSILYSKNGINWTISTSANAVFPDGVSIVSSNGPLFVAYAMGGTTRQLGYSTDGINWTASTTSGDIDLASIAWNGSYWLAVGGNYVTSPNVLQSYDGINWSETVNVGGDGTYLSALCWNGSFWVMSGIFLTYTSTDAITWTSSMPLSNDQTFSEIAWDGSKFIAVSYDNPSLNTIYYGYDGLTWAPANCDQLPGTNCYGIASNRVLPNVGQGSGGGGGGGSTGATGPTGSGGIINWTGPYNAGTTYNLNDGVIGPDGYGYVLAAPAIAGTAPPDTDYWALISTNIATGNTGETGSTGPTGASGVINWLGEYDGLTTYYANDGVVYNGIAYVYTSQTPGAGITPPADPWGVVAGQPYTGPTGPAGTGGGGEGTGYTGPTGPAGGGTGDTGPTGPAGGGTGATGPTGSVLIYATVFDGGNASTNYIIGPVFNCGGAQ